MSSEGDILVFLVNPTLYMGAPHLLDSREGEKEGLVWWRMSLRGVLFQEVNPWPTDLEETFKVFSPTWRTQSDEFPVLLSHLFLSHWLSQCLLLSPAKFIYLTGPAATQAMSSCLSLSNLQTAHSADSAVLREGGRQSGER